MIERLLSSFVKDNAGWFPVVSVTGPRQSGKSTLVQHVFPDYEYVNLEDEATRNLALADPAGFIRERTAHLIIDEAQRVPELFSAIQVASDASSEPGQYIISGSQNFLLLKQISQTLAGRNPDLYFYRDDSKIEVDLVDVTERTAPELVEIKSTTTFKGEFARHLRSVGDVLGIPEEGRAVVMRSDESHMVNNTMFWSAHDWLIR